MIKEQKVVVRKVKRKMLFQVKQNWF